MAHVELRDACITFYRRQRITFKEFVLQGLLRRGNHTKSLVQAIDGMNLTIHEGDRVGVIGHNGAGKSTLLKLLAGIYPTTAGECFVQGKVGSLLDLGIGIEQDANGWENMAYRGYLQGLTPKDVRDKTAAIADFCELGDFLDMPVRYYSTGMLLRLAFAIATSIEPEILLIDEIFGAGDISFQEKARKRMEQLVDRAHILVMSSHDLLTLTKICNRIIWVEKGKIRLSGPADEVVAAYTEYMQRPAAQQAA